MPTTDDRPPPTKIRVTGLQEAQLASLQHIEDQCAATLYEAGLTPEQVRPLRSAEIAKLFRAHELFVAEADHQVAGYLAWRDEPPKVGCLAILNVAPELQRFGVGTRLLRAMGDSCRAKEIEHAVARCWQRSPGALSFLEANGFRPVPSQSGGGDLPEPVRRWRDELAAAGELVAPGQAVYFRATDGLGVKVLPGIPQPE